MNALSRRIKWCGFDGLVVVLVVGLVVIHGAAVAVVVAVGSGAVATDGVVVAAAAVTCSCWHGWRTFWTFYLVPRIQSCSLNNI